MIALGEHFISFTNSRNGDIQGGPAEHRVFQSSINPASAWDDRTKDE
jgi:hypothetical protein